MTSASPIIIVARATSSVVAPFLGKTGTADGRALETICASTGIVRLSSARTRLASNWARRRSSSARFDLASASRLLSRASSGPALTMRDLMSATLAWMASSRRAATLASLSRPSTIFATSAPIWPLSPLRSAVSWRMRGCPGRRVADSSEICRSTRTRLCTRLWISGDFWISASVSALPSSCISRAWAARASASLRVALTRNSSALRSASCCSFSPVACGPPLKIFASPRNASTAASAAAASSASRAILGSRAFCTSSVSVRL